MGRIRRQVWGAAPMNPLLLDAARVRELRQLCHPDRHNNSDLSRRVSGWLNEVSKVLDTPRV